MDRHHRGLPLLPLLAAVGMSLLAACGGASTVKPEAPARAVPARHPLVGIWEDPDSSIRHDIRAQGDGVTVAAAVDKDDGEVCLVQSQRADGERLEWSVLVPSSGVTLSMRLVRPEGTTALRASWTNSLGNSGETILKRIK